MTTEILDLSQLTRELQNVELPEVPVITKQVRDALNHEDVELIELVELETEKLALATLLRAALRFEEQTERRVTNQMLSPGYESLVSSISASFVSTGFDCLVAAETWRRARIAGLNECRQIKWGGA